MSSNGKTAKRNFSLIDSNGQETGTFTGAQPRDAALKAANRGVDNIILREKGTNKLHYFTGDRELVPAPKNAPAWLQESAKNNDGKIYKANVEKFGTAALEHRALEKNNKALFRVKSRKELCCIERDDNGDNLDDE